MKKAPMKKSWAEWEKEYAKPSKKTVKGITETQYKILKSMVNMKNAATNAVKTVNAMNKKYGKTAKKIGQAAVDWGLPPQD